MSATSPMSLTEHLAELRNRLIIMISAVGVFFLGSYYFSPQLLELIQKPIGDQQLVFLSPTEAFISHIKVSFYSGLFLSIPVILFHIWKFCAPGLFKKEKKYLASFILISSCSFIVGAFFCYLLILPYGLNFLLSFASENLSAQISIAFYISFVFKLILIFGLVFQVPLIVILLVKMGVLSAKSLANNRGYVFVGSFAASAILTPPDVVTQIFLALPLIVLFEISIIGAKFIDRSKEIEKDNDE
ncbi:MAG: twin-arginine translocase subunit TatC [Nitrospinota bacterium]|nr:twin-arginine translocase subunit TatC [Nitrospinota bacterium]